MPSQGRADGVRVGSQNDFFSTEPKDPERPRRRAKADHSSDADVQVAFELYVRMARDLGLSVPQLFNKTRPRWKQLKARLLDAGGLEGWKFALDKVRCSAFLRGEGGRETWRGAHLDFLLQPSSFTRVMEGVYDDNPRAGRRNAGFDERSRTLREGVAGALGVGAGGGGPDDRGRR